MRVIAMWTTPQPHELSALQQTTVDTQYGEERGLSVLETVKRCIAMRTGLDVDSIAVLSTAVLPEHATGGNSQDQE